MGCGHGRGSQEGGGHEGCEPPHSEEGGSCEGCEPPHSVHNRRRIVRGCSRDWACRGLLVVVEQSGQVGNGRAPYAQHCH